MSPIGEKAVSVMAVGTTRPSARERLLAAADELFYREGIHVVGIDRVIEHAGVAKATLYNSFGSKDELVRAYLQARHATIEKRITNGLTAYATPREKILGVFDIQGARFAEPDFRGCPFVSATAEAASTGTAAVSAAQAYRAWVRGLFTDLATRAGAANPDSVGHQLLMIYDGVAITARLDGNPRAGLAAGRALASTLLDGVLGPA